MILKILTMKENKTNFERLTIRVTTIDITSMLMLCFDFYFIIIAIYSRQGSHTASWIVQWEKTKIQDCVGLKLSAIITVSTKGSAMRVTFYAVVRKASKESAVHKAQHILCAK